MANESRKRLWPDEDEWLDTFREYLCGHPELGEHVARIWFALIEHLGQGPEGVRDARFILNQALRLTYPFTRSYRLAYRHYLLSLTGFVKPEDEPEQLLKRRSSGPEPQSRNPASAGRNRIFTSPTDYAGHSEVERWPSHISLTALKAGDKPL